MDPKRLLTAHGEKVVVAVVAVIAGISIYSSFTDASIRPKGINQQEIQDSIDLIKKVMLSSDAPNFKAPLPYLQNMQARFADELPKPARLSWLMAHPDVGGGPGGTYFYIFELNQPSVDAKDDIGRLEVTLSAPTGAIIGAVAGERRAASDIEWPRQSEKGQIVNSAKILGIQVEMKIGQLDFHPLTAPGISNGFITIDQLHKIGGLLKFASDATWQPVSFRVRTVLRATGYTGDNPDADETVLVHAGPMDAEPDWNKLSTDVVADPLKLQDYLAYDDANPPGGVALVQGQHLYYSDWTSPITVVVTANVRFAFEKTVPDPANPTGELGVFLVSKQYQTPSGNVWLEKPVEFKVPLNQVVGEGKVKVHTPTDPQGFLSLEDLSTPFQLVQVDHDQPRTWFWEVHAKTPPTPAGAAAPAVASAKAKELELEPYPHDHKIDVAVLKNTKTGELLRLPKLEKLTRPTDGKVIYVPLLSNKTYDEKTEFEKSPAGFVQREMEPIKPALLDPADPKGALSVLSKGDGPMANVAESNTPYAQLSDGRLVWWNDLNSKLLQYPEPVVGKDDVVQAPPPPPASHARLQPNSRHPKVYQPPNGGGGPPSGFGPNGPSGGPGGGPGGPGGGPGGGGPGGPGGPGGGGYPPGANP